MTDFAIRAEGVKKRYRIVSGEHTRAGAKTLRDALSWRLLKAAHKVRTLFNPDTPPRNEGFTTSDFWALDGVSFEIQPGEVVGLIGRNGAGKSTLLKVLSRITEPTAGRLELRGRVGSLLEVGTGFHPELSGRENIYLNGAILGMHKVEIDRKFDEIVAFSEIEKFLDTPVKRYSSGMYVRLAFAVAAHLEPEILLVDEVLAVGDAAFQKKCLGKMGEVAKSGRTVIFVSHNMGAVEQLCTSCLLLERGRIKQSGADVSRIIRDYLIDPNAQVLRSEWHREDDRLRNPWFVPERFFIGDADGQPLRMPLRNIDEMWVYLEGTVADEEEALTIGYALFSEDGHQLYWSYQTDQDEPCWPRLSPGRHLLRSRIPTRMLNEGIYRLEFIGGIHYREWICAPGSTAPSIFLQIQGGLSDSPLWMNKRPGLLAPVLSWEKVS